MTKKERAQQLQDLRDKWQEAWGIEPHKGIGSTLLRRSLAYKLHETEKGGLPQKQQAQLDKLISQYKKDPNSFGNTASQLKPGTQLVKVWRGKRYTVHSTTQGFEYLNKHYGSLSAVAEAITGTRWNGRRFFAQKNS